MIDYNKEADNVIQDGIDIHEVVGLNDSSKEFIKECMINYHYKMVLLYESETENTDINKHDIN